MKINKIKITYGLFLALLFIAILAVFMTLPNIASAQFGTYQGYNTTNYNNPNPYNPNNGYNNYPTNGGTTIPAPIIYSLGPNSIRKSSSPVTVAVIGNNFAPDSKIKINGIDQNTIYMGSTRLDMQINNTNLLSVGIVSVSVHNPYPNSAFSNSVNLTVLPPINTNTPNGNSNPIPTNTSPLEETLGNVGDEGLAANALLASDGFLPANLVQWIIFFIFILLIVYLWRKIYHAQKEQERPMKHA